MKIREFYKNGYLLKKGIIDESSHRDRRGWRLFSQADVKKIEEVAHEMQ